MLIDENNVQELLVKASENKAVFIYFFVKDAPECQKATDAVKANVPENNEYVSLAEADVSSEVGQAIAMQLGLRSVPTLVVLKKAQPVDMQKALSAYEEDSNRMDLKFMLARICIKTKNLEKAHELLDNAGREEQSSQEYKDLISSLTLAEQAADSPQIRDLQEAFAKNPQDMEIAKQLAIALSEGGRHEEALNMLFEILKKDLGNAEIKKTFLDILSTLSGNPLQKTFRRKLYTLMY